MDSRAQAIVEFALALRAAHPDADAVDVLDRAMQPFQLSDPDFEDVRASKGNHTDPRAPFGRLLRDAFAPELTDDFLADRGTTLVGLGEEAFWSFWESEVIRPFAERYALWGINASRRTTARERAQTLPW